MLVFTVGYEGLDVAAFLSVLSKHHIQTVVDVRELPLSRKPGFSKSALAKVLEEENRTYVHMPALGCPKLIRDRYRADHDWNRYTKGFLKHLEKQSDAIIELSSLAASARCALMCFEADHNYCHRTIVADAVATYSNAKITHLPSRQLNQ